MEYRKPEVIALADALSSIQGHKNDMTKDDGRGFIPPVGTTAAYESDE
jgi:hypothetical protein